MMDEEISVKELRELMEMGKPVTIVDIRTAADRSEWWIPGSVHVDAYAAVKAGHPGPLGDVNLPVETPVVTICGVGKTSALASTHLRSRGLKVRTLAGGMKAWSLAWNSAAIDLPRTKAQIVQVRRTGKGCLSYLLGSDGVGAVIDPSVDPQVYLEMAARRGWTITQVLETHVHADHLSRARQVVELTGATLSLPAQDRVRFAHSAVQDGDAIRVGAATLTAWRSPGHTAESTCYFLEGAVFTGDTLFLAAVGRPDLGADAGDARLRATALYHSLKRLLALAPGTLVLPGHTGQPVGFDEIPVADDIATVERRLKPRLRSEQDFVSSLLGRIPAPPPNHARIVAINEDGSAYDGDVTELEAGANRCAVP